MIVVILAISISFLVAEESFITQFEYGQMLYKNPRGIGCNKCHGLKGEETLIVSYKHRKKVRDVIAPEINSLTYERFAKVFTTTPKKRNIMPRYFLTQKEIQTLYIYLKKIKSKEENNQTKQ